MTLLEIPGFCIKEYNRVHGHISPELLKDHHHGLQAAIKLVNESIRVINRRNGKKSPNFNAAIEKTRKNNSKSKKYRWTLDGMHPNPSLSKYWLRKIVETVRKKCY